MSQDLFNQMVYDAARDHWAQHLNVVPEAPALLQLVQDAIKFSDDLLDEISNRDIPDIGEIACQKGCTWCCYQQVGVTTPQALHIADYIRHDDATAALAALQELDDLTRGMTNIERIKVQRPCAFLGDQGACSIYPVRPFACRGANSMDADICRRTIEEFDTIADEWRTGIGNPWIHRLPNEAMARLQDGVLAATVQAGLLNDKLELTAAVRIALEDPEAGSKWLSGEDVFEAARLPELKSVWDEASEGQSAADR